MCRSHLGSQGISCMGGMQGMGMGCSGIGGMGYSGMTGGCGSGLGMGFAGFP